MYVCICVNDMSLKVGKPSMICSIDSSGALGYADAILRRNSSKLNKS